MSGTVAGGPAVWHDVECASYVADLPLWRDLADGCAGRIVELGCGTGRVALDLAARGHEVAGIDADRELTDVFNRRARELALEARASVGDARSFRLAAPAALILLPMQVAQLLGGTTGRRAMLAAAHASLVPGGTLAAALADPFEGIAPDRIDPPAPDLREDGGWVFSSMPIAVHDEGDAVVIDRVRQAVSPDGELTDEVAAIALDKCPPDTLESEARGCGFEIRERRFVLGTPDYVGSDVVVLGRPA